MMEGGRIMQSGNRKKNEQWLNVSAQILQEEPKRLQYRLLQIYKDKPALSCYATELAQLRMIGPMMEKYLLRIWDATSSTGIDQIIGEINPGQPTDRALRFLARLVKEGIEQGQTTH